MSHHTHTTLLVLSLSLALGCSGCGGGGPEGPALHSVQGIVTLDGSPVAGANVEFAPVNSEANKAGLGGSGAIGSTDETGKFVMFTGRNEGVQEGEYKVSISKTEGKETTLPDGTDAYVEEELFPSNYNKETELSATVPAGGTDSLTFELSSE